MIYYYYVCYKIGWLFVVYWECNSYILLVLEFQRNMSNLCFIFCHKWLVILFMTEFVSDFVLTLKFIPCTVLSLLEAWFII